MEELKQENEQLRAELDEVKAELVRLKNPEDVTLASLALKFEDLLANQQGQIEKKLDEMLGDDGPRGPPPSALPLAETLTHMEGTGMTPEQIQEAHELFDMYDHDSSGSIDNEELMDALRLLGESPTEEDVTALIQEVDVNENGDLTLNEFLTVYEQVVTRQAARADETGVETEKDTKSARKLSDVSFYGVGAMMRWVHFDGDAVGGNVTGPDIPCYRAKPRTLLLSKKMETVFYVCICLSAVNSGIQTYPEYEKTEPVVMLGWFTNIMFAFECALKLVADSGSCGSLCAFFADVWNTFDFLVLIALLILTPLTSSGAGAGAVRVLRILRLLRALRILRAARVFPQLTLVLETLIRSTASVLYIMAFLTLISYIFAIVGVTVFGQNDPFFFGNLGRALVTLFRIATLEGWTQPLYFAMYGCEGMGGGLSSYEDTVAVTIHENEGCNNEANPVFGFCFFGFYIFIAGFLMLNLFIGVIMDSMVEMKSEVEEKRTEAKAWAVATRLKSKAEKLKDLTGDVAGGVGGAAAALKQKSVEAVANGGAGEFNSPMFETESEGR